MSHAEPTDAAANPTPSIEIELLGKALDANELITRIHAGQGTDINRLIERAAEERPVLAEPKPIESLSIPAAAQSAPRRDAA